MNNYHLISRFEAWKREYEAKGDLESAARMQDSIDRWSGVKRTGPRPKPKPSVWNRMPLGIQFLIVVIAGLLLGTLVYFFLEYFLVLIFIIPGFIAFLGQALKNGTK